MEQETILKRKDGSKIKLTSFIFIDSIAGTVKYTEMVRKCLPGKRKFFSVPNTENWDYRELSMDDRAIWLDAKILDYVTAEEIYENRLKLWDKLKPIK